MTVLLLEKVPASLRGELSRWLLEPKGGVFVGQISAMVRERLWELAVQGSQGGAGMLLWSSPTEQGFAWKSFGDTTRSLIDFEGLWLVHIPGGPKAKLRKGASARKKPEIKKEESAPE
jgi:CRISPR-associated protein Cas2